MRADLAFAGACCVIAVVFIWGAQQIPHLQIGDPLGPRVFPTLLGAVLLFGAALLIWETVSRRRAASGPDAEDEPSEWTIEPMVVITLVAMVPLAYFLETIGYVPSFTIFLTLLTTLLRRDRFWSNLLWSTVFTLILYAFMAKFLGAGLPAGLLPW